MQVGDAIAIRFDAAPNAGQERRVGRHVEENSTGVAHQCVGPGGDHQSADDAHHGIHPNPSQEARGRKAQNGEHGYRGIGCHVNEGRAQIVIAVSAVTGMFGRLLELERVCLGICTCTQCQAGSKFVRLWNDIHGLEIGAAAR